MSAPDNSAQHDAVPGGTVIHRKVQAGLAEHQSRAMSLAKALRVTLAKVADDLFDLSMAAIGVRVETRSGDDLPDALATPGLLMLLEGPGRGRAAAILDAALVGGLIQQQTMGKVLAAADPQDRPLTPTDAAICAPFVDALLQRAALLPEKPKDQQLIAGFAFGAWVEDARILTMALDAPDYELIHLNLDIAGGVRQGTMLLCMPRPEAGSLRAQLVQSSPGADGLPTPAAPASTLSQTAVNLPATLRVSLETVRMSLRQLGSLKIGSQIDLGTPRFDNVRIQTIAAKTVTRGQLGQVDGKRVVQVLQQGKTAADNPAKRGQGGHAAGAGLDLEHAMNGLTEMDLPLDLADDLPAAGLSDLPDLPDLPDIPDLPDLPDLDETATDTLADGPFELPDLPDMSDLPDFDEMVPLPKVGTG